MTILNGLAKTPPMGWNSWDCYGTTVREDEVKANADYMAANMARSGWEYIVVDIQWSEPNARAGGYRSNAVLTMDEYSRLIPATNRFPSAAEDKGFKPLADYVHSLGLKFGIHIMRGIPRQAVRENTAILGTDYHAVDVADQESICRWNDDMFGLDMSKPGAQTYYDSLFELYASWEVDYVKCDDINWPYRTAEITGIAEAIKKCGRHIVLSLSPGNAGAEFDQVDHLRTHCELSRISDDFWDRWEDLKAQFELCRRWSPYRTEGYWPDADMLPLGRISIRGERGIDRQSLLTHDEQITLMTLWAIFRSPLMMGGDLPSLDDFTLGLLTNDELLALNQASSNNQEVFQEGEIVAWGADNADGTGKYLAFFNLGDAEVANFEINFPKTLGLTGQLQVRDVWEKKEIGLADTSLKYTIPAHGSVLYLFH